MEALPPDGGLPAAELPWYERDACMRIDGDTATVYCGATSITQSVAALDAAPTSGAAAVAAELAAARLAPRRHKHARAARDAAIPAAGPAPGAFRRSRGADAACWDAAVAGPADAFLADCAALHGALRRSAAYRSFWVGSQDAPRCAAEAFAQGVAAFHGATDQGGAELWVQLRGDEALPFHWDTDQRLREETGAWRHPDVSTVTYGTGAGAPTVVLPGAYDGANVGAVDDTVERGRAFACGFSRAIAAYPAPGRHVAFDGALLHGVPPSRGGDVRATLVVNVWRASRPRGVPHAPGDAASALAAVGAYAFDPHLLAAAALGFADAYAARPSPADVDGGERHSAPLHDRGDAVALVARFWLPAAAAPATFASLRFGDGRPAGVLRVPRSSDDTRYRVFAADGAAAAPPVAAPSSSSEDESESASDDSEDPRPRSPSADDTEDPRPRSPRRRPIREPAPVPRRRDIRRPARGPVR